MESGKFKALIALLIMFSFMAGQDCMSQNALSISDPKIQLQENLLHISYDILNSIYSDKFDVRIEITDTKGNIIEPKAMVGDVGEAIGGGKNKKVTWDLEADSVYLNANINFTIFAKLLPKPEPLAVKVNEDVAVEEQKSIEHAKEDPIIIQGETKESRSPVTASNVVNEKEFNRTGLILQSLPLPGLGLSRLKGKPHWLKGLAGYGCIGGAVYFSYLSKATYADYNAATTENWQTYYRDVAVWQENLSLGFAGAALGIWITDIIWTAAGTKNLNRLPLVGDMTGLQFGMDYERNFSSPMVKLTYTF